ncbi:MAG: RNA methyltransferase [Candidatus Shapirobacteria bacterium]|jgi:tRNA (guanosine-2'-O-)-methyltransferase
MEKTLRQDKIKKVINNRQEGIIVLENIADPHNAAAVWRTADAFGFQKIYLVYSQEKAINPKKIGKKSSSSANKWLSFKLFKNIETCYTELKKEGYKIYATVLDEEAKEIRETRFCQRLQRGKGKIAIVLGNEHRGLSEEAIKGADEKIYIPMKGMVQSLNISVTAAILMYEVDKQRSASAKGYSETKGDFKLDKKEREKLKKEFLWK